MCITYIFAPRVCEIVAACSAEKPLTKRKQQIINAMKLTKKIATKVHSRLPSLLTIAAILTLHTVSAFAQGIRCMTFQ